MQFIIAVVAEEAVGAFLSKQHIVLRPAEERIITHPTLKMVVPGTTIQEVRSPHRTKRKLIVQPIAIE